MNARASERFELPATPQQYEQAAREAIPEKCLEQGCALARRVAFYAGTDYYTEQLMLSAVAERTRRSIVKLCGISCATVVELQ